MLLSGGGQNTKIMKVALLFAFLWQDWNLWTVSEDLIDDGNSKMGLTLSKIADQDDLPMAARPNYLADNSDTRTDRQIVWQLKLHFLSP